MQWCRPPHLCIPESDVNSCHETCACACEGVIRRTKHPLKRDRVSGLNTEGTKCLQYSMDDHHRCHRKMRQSNNVIRPCKDQIPEPKVASAQLILTFDSRKVDGKKQLSITAPVLGVWDVLTKPLIIARKMRKYQSAVSSRS